VEVIGKQPTLLGASYFYLIMETFKDMEWEERKSPRWRLLETVAAKRGELLGQDHPLTLEAEAFVCIYLAMEEESSLYLQTRGNLQKFLKKPKRISWVILQNFANFILHSNIDYSFSKRPSRKGCGENPL